MKYTESALQFADSDGMPLLPPSLGFTGISCLQFARDKTDRMPIVAIKKGVMVRRVPGSFTDIDLFSYGETSK